MQRYHRNCHHPRRATFELLPENVLLDIFAIRAHEDGNPWRWDRVANVCRTWRRVVLSSSRRLKLLLLCTYGKPVADILDHWSALPIFIDYDHNERRSLTSEDEDNIIHALHHSSRVFRISFPVTPSLAAKLATVPWVEKPFPMLVCLGLSCSKGGPEVTLPKEFLNTSVPRLAHIRLEGVAVPSLPKILTSIGDQVRNLIIKGIPEAGYFSPAALIPHMSTLSHLGQLDIHYPPSSSHPRALGRARSLSSPTTAVLLALTKFQFRGASEDLEDLVSRFVAPRLRMVKIRLHNQLTIDLTHLALFLSRCNILAHCTRVNLNIRRGSGVSLRVKPPRPPTSTQAQLYCAGGANRPVWPLADKAILHLDIECKPLDWQISALAQICTSLHHAALSTMIILKILLEDPPQSATSVPEPGQDEPEPEQWLELLQPFNTVEQLWLIDLDVSSRLCQVLRALPSGGEALSVLPALRELFLEAEPGEQNNALAQALGSFVEARRLADRPVIVSHHASYPITASRS
ncbi:hypothetical protein BC834DRAFT_968719 [Gloeopeniophorella convolvens]|nr:hypothetical protein BC834DRAFT_968719 [Gloeopeniophorella convolvens]